MLKNNRAWKGARRFHFVVQFAQRLRANTTHTLVHDMSGSYCTVKKITNSLSTFITSLLHVSFGIIYILLESLYWVYLPCNKSNFHP